MYYYIITPILDHDPCCNHYHLDEFLMLAKTAQRIAVHQEISADRLTSIGIIDSLASEMIKKNEQNT
ncbi:MAG: hypothetical protein A3F17_07175 [Gammaproteobacteria bacterium RIFCSPHIGHO2_12_FULL_41_15]|nr:MAG: hypothetical protein A3F17_07175 [Gammaproteobacteria bacterium RIFCSPHIGHO2_12_FULL_41_15]